MPFFVSICLLRSLSLQLITRESQTDNICNSEIPLFINISLLLITAFDFNHMQVQTLVFICTLFFIFVGVLYALA
jgi:hypothetical protein